LDSYPVSDVMAAFRRVHTRSNRDINNENEDTENAIYCYAEFAVSSLAVAGPSPVLIARPGWLVKLQDSIQPEPTRERPPIQY